GRRRMRGLPPPAIFRAASTPGRRQTARFCRNRPPRLAIRADFHRFRAHVAEEAVCISANGQRFVYGNRRLFGNSFANSPVDSTCFPLPPTLCPPLGSLIAAA